VLGVAVLHEHAAELAVGLPDRPREVDVPVVTNAFHLHEHLVARLPAEAIEPSVELRPVEEPGHSRREVDEHAEFGVAVDDAAVESVRNELLRGVASEVEHNVLLVWIADATATVDVDATNDTGSHLSTPRVSGLKRLSKASREQTADYGCPGGRLP